MFYFRVNQIDSTCVVICEHEIQYISSNAFTGNYGNVCHLWIWITISLQVTQFIETYDDTSVLSFVKMDYNIITWITRSKINAKTTQNERFTESENYINYKTKWNIHRQSKMSVSALLKVKTKSITRQNET